VGETWPLPADVEAALLRVAQEGLANVAKHAGATTARLTLEYAPDLVRLCICDDGVGFDQSILRTRANAPGPWAGFGVLGMRERLAALGGSLELTNRGGAQVAASVPRQGSTSPIGVTAPHPSVR
jgi:signal transduction histidine kinase